MSKIWDYFVRKDKSAVCNVCKKELSLGHFDKKKQTTYNIKNHMEKMHPEKWKEFIKSKEIAISSVPQKRKKTVSEINLVSNELQITLPESIERTNFWPDDHPLALKTDKTIMDLIIVDMLPYSIVEGEAFQRLRFGNPSMQSKYNLKTEKFFRTSLMPATYDKVLIKVVDALEKANWISITTDIWTNSSKSCSLLSLTAHMVQGAERVKVILGAKVLEEDHTGYYIAEKFTETIKNFKIENKVHLIISDNARNMSAAMRIGEFKSFGCVAHTLQLVLHDCVLKNEEIDLIIKKCRKIVGHFKKSEQAYRHLEKYQEMCNLPKHKLIQDVVTRWNSMFKMLERLLEQKSALVLYATEKNSIDIPNGYEWKLISELISILEPFYEATLELSFGSASISIVIPLVRMLQNIYNADCEEHVQLEFLKKKLIKSINNRFQNVMKNELMVATLLDPRFKHKYFSTDQVDVCKNIIHKNKDNNNNEEECEVIESPIHLPVTDNLKKKQTLGYARHLY